MMRAVKEAAVEFTSPKSRWIYGEGGPLVSISMTLLVVISMHFWDEDELRDWDEIVEEEPPEVRPKYGGDAYM